MILKRLYIRGRKYGYFFHPEIRTYHEFIQFGRDNPFVDCDGLDNATYVIDCLSHEEQHSYWSNCIKNIMFNTRHILDNLNSFPEFKVRWNYYGSKRVTVGKPPEKVTTFCDNFNFIK